jgi:hypothetical protein
MTVLLGRLQAEMGKAGKILREILENPRWGE